jgi:hypothetical protein
MGVREQIVGRQPWTTRPTVEDCLCFDAAALHRDGVFSSPYGSQYLCRWESSWGGVDQVLSYTTAEWPGVAMALCCNYVITDVDSPSTLQRVQYKVQVTTTSCRFGGRRFWFRCPLTRNGVPCRRRVRCLYLPPGAPVLGCRACHNLTYRSCQEEDKRVYLLANTPELIEWALRYRDFRWQKAASRAITLLLKRAQRKPARRLSHLV